MKIMEIAFAMLVFNVCFGLVAESQVTNYPMYYESEYVNTYGTGNPNFPQNISTISETQQYSITMNIFDLVISTVTFAWIYHIIPPALIPYFTFFVVGLTAIMWFLVSVALIELFVKQYNIIGGNTS